MPNLGPLLHRIADGVAQATERGRVADYIPTLARVDPKQFGIVIVLADGSVHAAGDADTPFSIQSVSKVFARSLALDRIGDALWRRVGREPSGSAFNSIVQLEAERGIPRNPFINASAIVVSDVILGDRTPREAIGDILRKLRTLRTLSGDDAVHISTEVAMSEAGTGCRNVALANYMKAFGNLEHAVPGALQSYLHQCALAISCRQLAAAGRYLALDGRDPVSGRQVGSPERAAHQRANADLRSL